MAPSAGVAQFVAAAGAGGAPAQAERTAAEYTTSARRAPDGQMRGRRGAYCTTRRATGSPDAAMPQRSCTLTRVLCRCGRGLVARAARRRGAAAASATRQDAARRARQTRAHSETTPHGGRACCRGSLPARSSARICGLSRSMERPVCAICQRNTPKGGCTNRACGACCTHGVTSCTLRPAMLRRRRCDDGSRQSESSSRSAASTSTGSWRSSVRRRRSRAGSVLWTPRFSGKILLFLVVQVRNSFTDGKTGAPTRGQRC